MFHFVSLTSNSTLFIDLNDGKQYLILSKIIFSYVSTLIGVFIRVLIDTTFNQVPSLINPTEIQNMQIHTNACTCTNRKKWKCQQASLKSSPSHDLLCHNFPLFWIQFKGSPYWIQSYSFFQVQQFPSVNLFPWVLGIYEQGFFYLPPFPISFFSQKCSFLPFN